MMMRKLLVLTVLITGIYNVEPVRAVSVSSIPSLAGLAKSASGSDQVLQDAFETQRSDFQVEGEGTVIRILADDLEGSRHQRFIIRLNSGQTLLIAHNIDLAPRINSLQEGDTVAFYGEYEWNAQGGVIHWTHHDPAGLHIGGWLKHEGRIYQ